MDQQLLRSLITALLEERLDHTPPFTVFRLPTEGRLRVEELALSVDHQGRITRTSEADEQPTAEIHGTVGLQMVMQAEGAKPFSLEVMFGSGALTCSTKRVLGCVFDGTLVGKKTGEFNPPMVGAFAIRWDWITAIRLRHQRILGRTMMSQIEVHGRDRNPFLLAVKPEHYRSDWTARQLDPVSVEASEVTGLLLERARTHRTRPFAAGYPQTSRTKKDVTTLLDHNGLVN